ncbi:ion channel [uncultured Erythrobacter sp.]|uniref:ion channel n=1 Tax=uncultured Erythrobacter sp. TaxID=263913 RepID=UPI002613726A|nr:ion channel [uncultured Erythrobacter sp.]
MLTQLVVGSALVCVTIVIIVGFMAFASVSLTRLGDWLISGHPVTRLMISLTGVVLWLLAALSIAVWVWAGAFLSLGVFNTLEESLYFSVVSFTTLGFGDVVIGKDWRLLSGVIAANGLILFSLITAFLIEFIARLERARNGTG